MSLDSPSASMPQNDLMRRPASNASAPLVRVIDVETAGKGDADSDAVIEIGAADLDLVSEAIVWTGSTLVDPGGVAIEPGARRVHQITDEMLAGAPRFEDAAPAFAGAAVYAAHRASFDRSRLRFPGVWLCTYKLALRAFPKVRAHGLQSLVKYVPLDLAGETTSMEGLHPHRALYDAACTAVLLREIARILLPCCESVADFLVRAERASAEPALLSRLRFGRHKGVAMAEVPSDYLRWLADQEDMAEDARFTARHHLSLRKAA